MTQRPESHVLENKSRLTLSSLFVDAGWVVNDIHEDYGEDFLVRIFENGEATPYFFFVQVKATDNIERLQTASGNIRVRIKTKTAKAWNDLAQPLFLILWDAQANFFYWSHVQRFFHTQLGHDALCSRRASIYIPLSNRLTSTDLPALTAIVREATKWSTTSQQSLRILQDHYTENKLALFGTAALTRLTSTSNHSIVLIDEVDLSLNAEFLSEVLQLLQNNQLSIGLRLRDHLGNILGSVAKIFDDE